MNALALTYEGQDFPESVLPLVDAIELTPETIARANGGKPSLDRDQTARLRELNAEKPLLIHGVSLSIGSADGWNDAYLVLLDQCFEAFPNVACHSEHLGFTRVEGDELFTMLPIPYTSESFELVTRRVEKLQARYGRPFRLEPVVNLLPLPDGDYAEAPYLNALVDATGCGVILDAYNLLCDARNHRRDVAAFLDELDMNHIDEIHIAGGVALDGVQLDIHTAAPEPETLAIAADVVARTAGRSPLVTFELLREGYEIIGDRLDGEIAHLRHWLTGLEHVA